MVNALGGESRKFELPAKIIEFPSGDQQGLPSLRSPLVTCCGLPPSADNTKIFEGLPGALAAKAIVLPSGDQTGSPASRGGKLSCRRPLPNILPTHKFLFGNGQIGIHPVFPLENSNLYAELPLRTGKTRSNFNATRT